MKRITAIILAGGRSRRLGLDKSLLRLDDETLLEATVKKVATLSDEVIVAGGPFPYPLPGARLVADIYHGCGPLGGIHAGLAAASNFHSLVVACDMPFLNIRLLRYIVKRASGYDVVIPRLGTYLEPLHAIYSRDCLKSIERQIEAGNFRVSDLLSEVRVCYVEGDEIERFDPQHLSFFNINTPEDLERAEEIYHSEVIQGAKRRGG
ncbi:MAG: molybdenum cofactor guanylyltransferase [Chloroflexota bacterium]|nr:molybdenum cofactor guanylyltransferase [Chloroflexota bacterium]